MRIAISTETDSGLSAPVAAHFGRCPYFTIVDVEGDEIKSAQPITNPYFPQHEPGAIPQFISTHGVQVMLAGGMGRRAVAIFEEFGIQPITGAFGTVQQAVEQVLQGQLAGAVPCSEGVLHLGHGHDHGHCS